MRKRREMSWIRWNPAGQAESTEVAQSRRAVRTALYFQMHEGELYCDMTVVRTTEQESYQKKKENILHKRKSGKGKSVLKQAYIRMAALLEYSCTPAGFFLTMCRTVRSKCYVVVSEAPWTSSPKKDEPGLALPGYISLPRAFQALPVRVNLG